MTDDARQPVTRLAPSPTGALHLGNARTFLVNWAIARQLGWKVVLRIEDLDGPRVKPGVIEQTIDTLAWLGLDWHDGPAVQSGDIEPYAEAMRTLAAKGLVYPCDLSRKQIADAANAPQEGASESRFPASLRPAEVPGSFDEPERSWRLMVEPGAVGFDDVVMGPQSLDPSETVGDFVVWTNRGQPSYQLAVVVDDHRQRVTEVVRGNDLLDSTARQLRLIRSLGIAPEPRYTHLPLVRGADGRRLAKRHGDTRLTHYRECGVPAERVIGLIAAWSGVRTADGDREPISAAVFGERFRLDTMAREDTIFTAEDDRWLRA